MDNQNKASQENWYDQEFAIECLQKCASDRGLDTGCDIELVFPHLIKSTNLLEIGAAYGRVLEHLQRLGYPNTITAIEKSQRFFNYLQSHYSEQIQLVHGDILNFRPEKKFDAILYMWSGICDFMPREQLEVLKNLKSLLNENGELFLEIIYTDVPPENFEHIDEQFYQLNEHGFATFHYIPGFDQILDLCTQAGLIIKEQIIYQTPKNIQRCIYILIHD